MQVAKWGNSLAVRLPANIVRELELAEGDNIDITVSSNRTFELVKVPNIQMIERLDTLRRGKIPDDFKLARNVSDSINRLVASGAATWKGGKPKGAAIVLQPGGKSLSDMVLEDR